MVLLVLDMVIAGVCLMISLNGNIMGNRGTNAVTRFSRDVGNMASQNIAAYVCVLTSIVMFLLGSLFKAPYACIPTVLVIVVTFIMKNKSTRNEQRVKDARYVTKGSLEVTSQVAEVAGTTVGTAVGTHVGNPLLGKEIGQAVGKATASITDSAAKNMVDTESSGIVLDVDGLIELAEKAGIPTAGKTPEQICDNVIAFAPQAILDRLPDNLSKEDKAKYIMAGNY